MKAQVEQNQRGRINCQESPATFETLGVLAKPLLEAFEAMLNFDHNLT